MQEGKEGLQTEIEHYKTGLLLDNFGAGWPRWALLPLILRRGKNQMPVTKEHLERKGFDNYIKSRDLLQTGDLVLMLLNISPIKGNTMMQKQVFLTWKEMFERISAIQPYYPYKYGAFNNILKDILAILEEKKYISIKHYGKVPVFYITNKGKNRISEKIKVMELNLHQLSKKKTDWEEWSAKGIVRYVYRKYPGHRRDRGSTSKMVIDVIPRADLNLMISLL